MTISERMTPAIALTRKARHRRARTSTSVRSVILRASSHPAFWPVGMAALAVDLYGAWKFGLI